MNRYACDEDQHFVRRFLMGGTAALVFVGCLWAYFSVLMAFITDPIIAPAMIAAPFAILIFIIGGVTWGFGLGSPPIHPPAPPLPYRHDRD